MKELSKWLIYTLMTLRFLIVFVLIFLLLSPVIRYLKLYFDAPVIILAQDNSESIGLVKSFKIETGDYKAGLEKFYDELSNDFDVRTYSFGERLNDSLSLSFDEKETDFSVLFDEIRAKYINYNVGALIIASDGIFNKGPNPVYNSQNLSFPIYTVALGDTTRKKDIIIKNAFSNSIAFLGDYFPVEVVFNSFGYENKTVNIKVVHKGNIVANQIVNIDRQDFSKQLRFDIKAEQKGLQTYQVLAEKMDDEYNVKNNSQQIVIDIVDDKMKILILSQAVHPDIGAIRQALESDKNIITESYSIDEFKKNIADYQLVIFHELPTLQYNIQKIKKELDDNKIPALYIIGPKANIQAFNYLKFGIGITNNKNLAEQINAKVNPLFRIFELDQKFIDLVDECPPLYGPFGNFNQKEPYEILLFQKIKGIDTDKPLFAIENLNKEKAKAAYLFGEGIWRWRIKDFLINENHEQFDQFINKIVQFMALDIKKDRFMLYHDRVFNENEDVIIRAEFYNQSFELTNEPEIQFELSNGDNKKFNYSFSRAGKTYLLNLGQLPQGTYQFEANTRFDGKKFMKRGEIKVVAVNIEHKELVANHLLMNQISVQSGGKFFYPNQLNELLKEIKENESIKPVSHSILDLVDLIELKWLFFILILFLSFEWFIRKFYGAY